MILPTASLMHPTLVARPVQHAVWVYEEKVDGYRMLAYKEGQSIRLVSRRGTDFTRRFPGIVAALRRLDPPTLILDGEVAIYDPPPSAGSAELDLMMDRRTFLGTLAGGLLAAPLAAVAQQAGKVPLIGFVEAGSRSANQHFADAFRLGLRELGYVEGQTIRVEERWADGDVARFPALLTDLLRMNVDVIVEAAGAGALAAKQLTSSVPIVFVGVSDPERLGLVESLARPGGNLTGLSLAFADGLAGKWVELFKEAVPRASRVAVLLNPLDPIGATLSREMQTTAARLGVKLYPFPVRDSNDFDTSFATMARDNLGGLIVLTDPLTLRYRVRIVALANRHRLPTVYTFGEFARAGGLMAYGPSVREMFRRAATFVDKILKGTKPSDLPVEQPTTYELVINLKTAKALGLTIPPSLLQRADQVIE